MTFSKAQQEFQIRYYLWATAEFEKEIHESFPNLCLFKAGAAWQMHQLMQQLDRSEQLDLAHALLRWSHSDAAKALGESLSEHEKSLLDQRRRFDLVTLGLEAEIAARKSTGETIKFASKNKLRRTILAKFKAAFGDQCFGLELVGLDPELDFKMKCCGWILETHFEFNGAHRQVQYWHDIVSPTTIEPHGIPAMMMSRFISFIGWFGIGHTQWEYLMPDDVELACDAVIKFCGHFLEVVPKLLKGLEFDKITGE